MDPTWKRILKTGAFYFLVLLIFLYAIVPFLYAIGSSLKTGQELFDPSLFPMSLSWSNYEAVFSEQPFTWNIINSIIVALAVVGLSLLLGVTAAFALSRIQFRGRGILLFTVLSVSMFPQVAVLSGMFELIRALGVYNRLPALIFSNMILTLPFTVWVLTTFMRDLPKELEEAAIMDGATSWEIIHKVFMPLMWPRP